MLNKRLGQHFLNNKQIIAEILRAGEVSKRDTVLEVGPGRGVLTEVLADKSKKVVAIEKDKELVSYLKERFAKHKNVKIIEGDILKIDQKNNGLLAINYKLIANIPYYITSRFLRIFLSDKKLRPHLMVLMIQKEVAERIIAKNGKESLLSLSVKAYGNPEIIRTVKRGNFSPPPKVDSAIIKISIHDADLRIRTNIASKIEKILGLAKIAFQQKRKMLRHSLSKNIPNKYRDMRPEDLTLDDWANIYLFQPSLSQKLEDNHKLF